MAPRIRMRRCECGLKISVNTRCQCQIQRDRARKAKYDQNRPSARERGYDSRWDKARAGYLAKHPHCVKCNSPANVVDHIIPHRGDTTLFWNSDNWQSLCTRCHSSAKQSGERKTENSLLHPFIDKRPTCKVVIVTGAPGSGKSHYANQHAKAGDVIIDMNEIVARLAGTEIYKAPDSFVKPALEERNSALKALHSLPAHVTCWFVLSEPDPAIIATWTRKLNAQVEHIAAPLDQCLLNISNDTRRDHDRSKHLDLCRSWFAKRSAAQKQQAQAFLKYRKVNPVVEEITGTHNSFEGEEDDELTLKTQHRQLDTDWQ